LDEDKMPSLWILVLICRCARRVISWQELKFWGILNKSCVATCSHSQSSGVAWFLRIWLFMKSRIAVSRHLQSRFLGSGLRCIVIWHSGVDCLFQDGVVRVQILQDLGECQSCFWLLSVRVSACTTNRLDIGASNAIPNCTLCEHFYWIRVLNTDFFNFCF
jgi:hypothetical protein